MAARKKRYTTGQGKDSDLDALIYNRSKNASAKMKVSENAIRRDGRLEPGGQAVVSPEGSQTRRIPQTKRTDAYMKAGTTSRKQQKAGEARAKRTPIARGKARRKGK